MSKRHSPSSSGYDAPFGFVFVDASNSANAVNLYSDESTATASATQTINIG